MSNELNPALVLNVIARQCPTTPKKIEIFFGCI
jgi:hypothetical protein